MMVLRRLIAEAKQRERTMALARGALAAIVEQRFAEWGLTEAESEVALFAVKGYGIAEIARLRDAAPGTVRAQLSRIYVKAGVTSQAMLIGGLIDEFIDVVPVREPKSEPVQMSRSA
jgi:DNA-binding CsgD family transcriptional regulator